MIYLDIDDFGITSEEIDNVLEDFKVEDEKDEIKKWYDGDINNPSKMRKSNDKSYN